MYVAFKKDTEPIVPKKTPPSRRERLQRFAEALEKKWRLRDRQEAIRKNDARIKKLGLSPSHIMQLK